MELCAASSAISDLPVFSTLLAGNSHLRPKHVLPLRNAVLSPRATRRIHLRYRRRRLAVSLPKAAAASDDSNGSSPLVTVFEDFSSASSVALDDDSTAEKLPSEEEQPKAPVEEEEDSPVVVTLEDSPSASSSATVEEESKEEPVEDAKEQAFELLNEFQLESVDTYGLVLYGTGAFLGLWLVSAIVGAVDSIPLVPKLLEVVGLGYTVWFTARFLLFKESREELAAKIDEVKELVLGSD